MILMYIRFDDLLIFRKKVNISQLYFTACQMYLKYFFSGISLKDKVCKVIRYLIIFKTGKYFISITIFKEKKVYWRSTKSFEHDIELI